MSEPAALQAATPRPVWWLALMLLACLALGVLTPPLQSPDEADHIKRAYLLTKGQLLLQAPAGSASGGAIDQGLKAYLDRFEYLHAQPQARVSAEIMAAARGDHWLGREVFSTAPGTGFYFPVVYAPQALALALGKALGLTIHESYLWARVGALLASLMLLWLAFRWVPPNVAVLGLFLLPMSLFQLASASLDGITHALSYLLVATFLKLQAERKPVHEAAFWVLVLAVSLVASCRAHLLPLLILPAWVAWQSGRRRHWVGAAAAVLFVLVWTAVAIQSTVHMRAQLGQSAAEVLGFYLAHPGRLVAVLGNTLGDPGITSFYLSSFIGRMGWLDAPLGLADLQRLGTLLAGLLLLALPWRRSFAALGAARGLLLGCGLLAAFLVMLALLVSWTPHPATVVEGVQGRYFFVPLLLLLAGLAPSGEALGRMGRGLATALLLVLLGYGLHASASVLLQRYWVASAAGLEPVQLSPGPWLSPQQSLVVQRSVRQALPKGKVRGLKLMFAKATGLAQGQAELRLRTRAGQWLVRPVALAELPDRRYHEVELPEDEYVWAELVTRNGGGVALWQVTLAGDEGTSTCIELLYSDGRRQGTKGCPAD